jgi:uncharacterized protein (TIGR03067 family)
VERPNVQPRWEKQAMIRRLALVAIGVGLLSGCSKTDYQKMGFSFWTVVSAEEGGKDADPAMKTDVITDSEILSDGLGAIDFQWTDPKRHKMKLDSAKTPKEIDLTHHQAGVPAWPGIYEINGDDLKICLDLDGKSRPTEFKTKPDDKHLLLVLKRKKQ